MYKKTLLSLAIISIICFGGFFVFIDFQERKLFAAVDHLIKKAEERQISASYELKKKNIFSFSPDVKITKLTIKMQPLEKNGGAFDEVAIQPDTLRNTEIIFEKLEIKSDLTMKNFKVNNIGDIKYSDPKDSGIIKDDFKLVLGFFENPFQKKFASESNIKNLRSVVFKDLGYQHLDMKNNLLDEYEGKSVISLVNQSNAEHYIYNIKIDTDQEASKVHDARDEKEKALNELMHAKTILDVDIKKTKAFSTNVNLDMKNLVFKTKESKINGHGKIQLSLVEQKIVGDGVVDFENYQVFLKLLKDAIGGSENHFLDFIEKTLPEISEYKADNILSLRYEQNERDIKIGNKDFAQLSKEYLNYIANIMKDKAHNFIAAVENKEESINKS